MRPVELSLVMRLGRRTSKDQSKDSSELKSWRTRNTSLVTNCVTLAMKKTANKTVFENIEKGSEERMFSGEFKSENEQQHRGSKLRKDLPRLQS